MIMITDYDFLSYVIFDQQLKITFRKSSASTHPSQPQPLKNSTAPFLLIPLLKIKKVHETENLLEMKIVHATLAKRGGTL